MISTSAASLRLTCGCLHSNFNGNPNSPGGGGGSNTARPTTQI